MCQPRTPTLRGSLTQKVNTSIFHFQFESNYTEHQIHMEDDVRRSLLRRLALLSALSKHADEGCKGSAAKGAQATALTEGKVSVQEFVLRLLSVGGEGQALQRSHR